MTISYTSTQVINQSAVQGCFAICVTVMSDLRMTLIFGIVQGRTVIYSCAWELSFVDIVEKL